MRRSPIRQGDLSIDFSMLKRVALMTPVMVLSAFGCFAYRLSANVPYEITRSETFTVLAVCVSGLSCSTVAASGLQYL